MNNTVIVALISFAGTLLGTAGGIIASGKLTEYRLAQLEKKVDAHSSVTARIPVSEEKLRNINIRINGLEESNNANYGYMDGS